MDAIALNQTSSIEAEQALLGAVLINNDALRAVDGLVTRDDFSEPLHGHLWNIMLEAERAGRRIDPKLLVAKLGPDAKLPLANLTVGQYVARLAAEATTVINAPDYARTIRDISDRGRLIQIGDGLCANREADPSIAATCAIDDLDAVLAARSGRSAPATTMAAALAGAIDLAAKAYRSGGRPTGISWGLSSLDRKTLGLQRSELVTLAARPGMGKSALALCVARRAGAAGEKVLFISLEMSDASLAQRMISDALYDDGVRLSYWALRAGKFTEPEFEAVSKAAARLADLPIKIEQQPALTAAQIAARARQQKRRHGLDLLIVDHLHLVRPSERYKGHRVEEIGETTRALKGIAKELDIPVLALCQLSRAVEGRDDKRPILSDLRNSGDIEQDSDVVAMLYRESYYLERSKPSERDGEAFAKWMAAAEKAENKLDVIIEKQRNGPVGTVRLFCSVAHNAARDLTERDTPTGDTQ